MSEWFKEHAWKACVGETQPQVRILPSPPYLKKSASVRFPVESEGRKSKVQALRTEPILVRTARYGEDFGAGWLQEIAGLFMMGIAVSLGAPFWNDVLKGMMGVNDALNGNGKTT